MGTDKRERQKARRLAQREASEQQARSQRSRERVVWYGGVFVVIVAAILGALVLFGDDEAGTPVAGEIDDSAPPDSSTPTPPPLPDVTIPPQGATIEGDTPCPADDGSSERTTTFEESPPDCIDPASTYQAEVVTTKGSFTIDLEAATAPVTVNNFVVLARYHYYDGIAFHRVIPGFVAQIGDAVGPEPGQGGPGYQIVDELPTDTPPYEIGSVAMANNSAPDTGGSQFFIVTGDEGAALPPQYSRFGTVTDGLDVVLDIESIGTASGSPTEIVTIESILVTEE